MEKKQFMEVSDRFKSKLSIVGQRADVSMLEDYKKILQHHLEDDLGADMRALLQKNLKEVKEKPADAIAKLQARLDAVEPEDLEEKARRESKEDIIDG